MLTVCSAVICKVASRFLGFNALLNLCHTSQGANLSFPLWTQPSEVVCVKVRGENVCGVSGPVCDRCGVVHRDKDECWV